MRTTTTLWALLLVGSSVTQCNPSLTEFAAPVVVQVGQPFTVVVRGTSPAASYHTSAPVGCIVQLPVGITVAQASNRWGAAMAVDTMIGACTAEAGHYLTSFVGQAALPLDGSLTLTLVAGPSAPAQATVKVVLGVDFGGWQSTSPATITDFAAVGGAHARTFTVTTQSLFANDAGAPVAGPGPTVVGDVDGDGNDDLVVWSQGGMQLEARLSRPGSAASHVVTPIPVGSGGPVALGDFDHDGHGDVVLGGEIRFGDGSGVFPTAVPLPVAAPVDFLGVGDADADGVDDLFGGNGSSLFMLRSNGDRSFTDWRTGIAALPSGHFYPASPWYVVDVTGDGHADLVGYAARTVANAQRYLVLARGDGAGNWQTGAPFAVGEATDLQVADLDGNGQLEVLVAAGSPAGPLFTAWTANSGGTWSAGFVAPTWQAAARQLRCFDYDRDGRLDVLAVEATSPPVTRLLRGQPSGGFAEMANHGLPTALPSDTMVLGDWNGDTFTDLASDLQAWQNQGTGARPFGHGCAGALPAPVLVGFGEPARGNTNFALELQAPPSGFALLWVGFSKRSGLALPPLPFDLTPLGAPGCTVFAEPRVLSAHAVPASGVVRLPLGIPNLPALHQLTLFTQGAALVPGANPLGALLSNAVAVRID